MPFFRKTRIDNKMLAGWKWLLSFTKSEWSLNDYPIRVTRQKPNAAFSATRFSQQSYLASIVNSAMTGFGNTPVEAMADLMQHFESVRQRQTQQAILAVRPGTNWPIEFSSQEKVSTHESLSEEFIRIVLGLDWAWISDESSLWDFHTEQTNALLLAKIRELYGVDVSDIQSARLWEIFERIRQAKAPRHDESL